MNIVIVSNMNSGIGLLRDAELLEDYLRSLGHAVIPVQYDEPVSPKMKADVAIFLEVAPRHLLDLSERRWIFVNPEWCKPDKIEIIDRHFEKVFAKTREAKRVLDSVFPGRVHYTGFLARDQYDPTVTRQPMFLHVGGNSTLRGTQALIDAFKWRKNGKTLDARLVVISTTLQSQNLPDNILIFHNKVEEKFLRHLQNQCMFHIYPSATEGFGHAIREGMSVGAVVMVPDAPPMNEIDYVYEFPATKAGKMGLADLYEVSALDLYDSIQEVSGAFGLEDIERTRKSFLTDNTEFTELFATHLEIPLQVPVVKEKRKKGGHHVAFIGNFTSEHSTENQILWALQNRLGYDVETLQENQVDYNDIREALDYNNALIWVKTPGWLQVDHEAMMAILIEAETQKIPTISIHLDKFWGIKDREHQIGVHPFWLTQYVWTADGSKDKQFAERGVNHYWMRPAVSEVYCHPGVVRSHYECDVCFVGAKEYHACYPFRGELLDFLEREYGGSFRHIQGIRGHDLNDVYASAKVVVGDCIFAGTPNYWSDRVPETIGRGGFLLHPFVRGLPEGICARYHAQDLKSLKEKIAAWLLNPIGRRAITEGGMKYVRDHDTWTLRMREIMSEAYL